MPKTNEYGETAIEGSAPPTQGPAGDRYDVVVAGAGPGGLAAAIHLGRAGLRVLCIEPDEFPHDRVGESLDWSSPKMLAELGILRDALVADQIATYKKHIEIVSPDRPAYQAQPEAWFRNPPLKFEIVTLHADRSGLDQRLYQTACNAGAEFLWDRAMEVESDGERITAIRTASGRRIEGSWFIDASGRNGRLFARKFQIPKMDYGRKKVCLWCHFDTPIRTEGTTFYTNISGDEYLSWTWEIPISPKVTSVGCVMEAKFIQRKRQQGKETRQILWDILAPYARFEQLLEEQSDRPVHAVSYQSYVYENACGPNWLIMGEAASLPDPLTANGVTAALRHASEGSNFILQSKQRGHLTSHQRWLYNTNLQRMGHVFNHSIETSIYENSIRWGLGVMPAQKIYTAFSYTVNVLYSKFQPKSWTAMACFGLINKGVWAWMETWALLGKINCFLRPTLRKRQMEARAPEVHPR